MLKAAGYTFVSGGKFQDGAADYTPQITKFKAAGCEILSGVFIPPDFVNFWHQSYQQGFKPVAATVGKALLFPAELEAIGPTGYGLTTECWWSPWHPFTSSLTGQTCQQLADAWTSSSGGKEWAQPLLHYAVFEVVVDALKRATSVDDKQVVVDAIKATDMDTIAGKVTWNGPGRAAEPGPERLPHRARGRHVGQGHEVPVRAAARRHLARGGGTVQRHHPGERQGRADQVRLSLTCSPTVQAQVALPSAGSERSPADGEACS